MEAITRVALPRYPRKGYILIYPLTLLTLGGGLILTKTKTKNTSAVEGLMRGEARLAVPVRWNSGEFS